MAADAGIFLVLAMHHRHGVPAHQALDSPLQSAVTGIRLFFIRGDGVDVGRVELNGKIYACLPGATRQRREYPLPQLGPSSSQYLSKTSIQPVSASGSGPNLSTG